MNAPAFNNPNHNGGEFLLIEAAAAHTLLDLAESTLDAAEARGQVRLARETLATVSRHLQSLEMDSALRAVLNADDSTDYAVLEPSPLVVSRAG